MLKSMLNWTIGLLKNNRGILSICFLFISSLLMAQGEKNLVVLHLNDTHSRIEPLPANDKRNPNKGGVIRQNAYIEEVRKDMKNVLLFHCGDFVQGTPYFNMFKGDAEVSVMNFMKYDAACLGNHEFDYGLEFLAGMLQKAEFPIIATNLDFSGTPVSGLTKNYEIVYREDIKIGIIGVCVSPQNLVAKQNYEGMKYLDPVESANKAAAFLKDEENCDLVICLSHLGYFPSENEMGDITLAKESRNIDMILGGHSHTFLEHPDRRLNLDGEEVVINQMGGLGIYVGRLDIIMEKEKLE